MSPRRKRAPAELDYPAPYVLELVEERVAELEASPPELPVREPIPLSTIELAWSLEDTWIEPYLARSIAISGGFRPILDRAGLRRDIASSV